MKKKIQMAVFDIVKFIIGAFYPKIELVGIENLPKQPSIVVGNHVKMNGPISSELYFTPHHYTWCAGQMMDIKEVPAYAYQDFWSKKPKYIRWFYKLAAYVLSPLSPCIFCSAHTIAVYHDRRVIKTFRDSMEKMKNEGAHIVIFPEYDAPHNHIVCDFQRGFVDLARMYYKREGVILDFVPLYNAPMLKKMYLGKPISFDPAAPIEEERERICSCIMDEITKIATSLPRHKVVPYNNIPKKKYAYNKPEEEKKEA